MLPGDHARRPEKRKPGARAGLSRMSVLAGRGVPAGAVHRRFKNENGIVKALMSTEMGNMRSFLAEVADSRPGRGAEHVDQAVLTGPLPARPARRAGGPPPGPGRCGAGGDPNPPL